MTKKPVIAIDLDDTLSATIESCIEYASKKLGIRLERGDITSTEYWAAYGVSEPEAIALVDDFNQQGHPGLRPLNGALPVLRSLTQEYELYIVTARDPQLRQFSDEWVQQHFPEVFQAIIFTGNPWLSEQVLSKSDVCLELEAVWMIDDSVSTITKCAKRGTKSILFGGHAWHSNAPEHPNIFRAADWAMVKDCIDGTR